MVLIARDVKSCWSGSPDLCHQAHSSEPLEAGNYCGFHARVPFQHSVAWWTSFAAIQFLVLAARLEGVSIAAFLGVCILYAAAWPGQTAMALLRTRLPFVFPAFALLSVLWSIEPAQTLRLAVQWIVTAGIGVMMARSMAPHRLLTSWMCALMPIIIIGGAVGGAQYTEHGDLAYTGIFLRKNYFALYISLTSLISIAVAADKRQKILVRVIAFAGTCFVPLLLWRARSIGAMIVCVPSVLVFSIVIVLEKIETSMRPLAIAIGVAVMITVSAVSIPLAISSSDALLSSVGKTGDLTGRGYLWYKAGFLIEQNPVLGVGYSAFWVKGNLDAEGLWRSMKLPSGAGFHFHNFYYETLVELGYVGLVIGLLTILVTTAGVLLWAVRRPCPASGFFLALMCFLLFRTYVELDLLGGFMLTTLAVPAAWVYATSEPGRSGWIQTGKQVHAVASPDSRTNLEKGGRRDMSIVSNSGNTER